ncbi:PepSY-associated TM helix domain-containing protein [Hylemonella gracilis]|uniref:PepSY domain-containing protein n=1 Tax=Hylemonella gracilis ATCC 19624 TaxID=887062 RepID=F3KUX6_9BURK|nr:PepSY domain-containing protein [Hylemonella gracilis]EGI76416.1 hypothetical protein HGR_11366 [Hylemonella gracilis ATCC 19624]
MNAQASPPTPPPVASVSDHGLYRRVWRWHFYAGLLCLPFLLLLAITGALYLYKEPIEARVYAGLLQVETSAAPVLDAEALVAAALGAVPGQAVRYVAPAGPDRSAEVGIRTPQGESVSVYVHPATGQVLGSLRDERKLMEVVKRLHSLVLVGPVANHLIEVVAGWAIVLAVTGVFLWWPRTHGKPALAQAGGVLSVRGTPRQRLWWRDVHAIVGLFAAAVIVFLAATGMPWSAFWGQQFGRISGELGIGLPKYLWGPGPSSSVPADPTAAPLAGLPAVPWTLEQVPLPQSAGTAKVPAEKQDHAHGHDAAHADADTETVAQAHGLAGSPDMGLNAALRIFSTQGLPAGTPVRLPSGPQGVYTALSFPDDVRGERVLHLDRYTGAVLADVGYKDYGIAGRVTEWGIALHTGRQFGEINRLLMLAGCLSIAVLAVTGVTMWWKRRPRGQLAAPQRRPGDRATQGAIGVAVLLGLLYPLLGLSMIGVLLLDTLIGLAGRRKRRTAHLVP